MVLLANSLQHGGEGRQQARKPTARPDGHGVVVGLLGGGRLREARHRHDWRNGSWEADFGSSLQGTCQFGMRGGRPRFECA